MAVKGRKRSPRLSDDYLKMIKEFPLVSIRSAAQFQGAQSMLDQLLTKGRLSGGEKLYLDALSDLVAAYEDVHHPIEPPPHADMLRHFLETRGLTPAALHRQLRVPKAAIAEVLAGRKKLTPALGKKLADFFEVDQSVFVQV